MEKFDLKKDLALVKSANAQDPDLLKQIIAPLAAAAGVAGAGGLYGYYTAKKKSEKHQDDLERSFGVMLGSEPSFKTKPTESAKLFGELAVMAPTVAKNPALASRLIRDRMKTGFTLDDVHKLSVIESSGGVNRQLPTPRAAAGAAATQAVGRLVDLIGADEWRRLREANKAHREYVSEVNKTQEAIGNVLTKTKEEAARRGMDPIQMITEDARKRRDAAIAAGELPSLSSATSSDSKASGSGLLARFRSLFKTSSEHEKTASSDPYPLLVSEQCMGRMLSDAVTITKQASAGETIEELVGKARTPTGKESFQKGLELLKSNIHQMMPAIMLGGGMALVKLVHDKIKDRAIINQADQNFSKLMQSSEIAKGNPEVAHEAYETIKMVAPVLATRPGVLREYIEGQASTGRLPNYEQVRNLAEAAQSVDRRSSGRGFITGMKDAIDFIKPKTEFELIDERTGKFLGKGDKPQSLWEHTVTVPGDSLTNSPPTVTKTISTERPTPRFSAAKRRKGQ